MAQLAPADKFAETHTWIKGQIKGISALFVDDMIQAGANASNVECLKACLLYTSPSPRDSTSS
eukprot:9608879-Prorocentrum_lima.AAC.1